MLSVAIAGQKRNRTFSALAETSTAVLMNINKLSMWVNDNGVLEKNLRHDLGGVTFPRGSATMVADGGMVWGGIVHDNGSIQLRVGGQAVVAGTIPGCIRASRLPENRYSSSVRAFRVRKDWKTADLRQDAAETFDLSIYDVTNEDIDEIRRQYTHDWLEWPWQKGAPYYERNGIAGYQADTAFTGNPVGDEPGLLNADQVVWLVCNDLSQSQTRSFSGSPPIGIEHQITCWAYAQEGYLGNVIYQRHKIIYKGTPTTPLTASIDSMYLAKWANVDIGDVLDDYAGYSVERNMGYAYNSGEFDNEYNKFELLPPVIAYDLVQGPRVPSVTGRAMWNSSLIDGYSNLPVTAFVVLVDSEFRDQPAHNTDYRGTLRWWNFFRGYNDSLVTPLQCYTDPFTRLCSPLMFSGDPRTFEGWVDGQKTKRGDRRLLLSSGPFTMALGDTQEVVYALIGVEGTSRKDRLDRLDSVDSYAQDMFSRNFETPQAIPVPHLRIAELDKTLILDWESDTASIRAVESFQSYGYSFETYKIYQYKSASVTSARIQLSAFDPAAPRSLHLKTDYLRNKPLVNGQKYYYGVTAVMVNPKQTVDRRRMESTVALYTAVPHSPNPGVVYSYAIGDTVTNVKDIHGVNDAIVNITVFDPTRTSGDSLTILFHYPIFYINALWDCIRTRTGDTLLKNIVINSPPQRIISEGLELQIRMQYFGVKGVYQTLFDGQPTRVPVFNKPNPGENYMIVSEEASQMDFINGATATDNDIEFRFLGDSSWALLRRATATSSTWVRVPYSAWQLDRDPSSTKARQLYTVITGQGQDSIWRPSVLLDREYNGEPLSVFYPVTVIVDSFQNYGGTYYDDLSHPDIPFIRGHLFNRSATNEAKTGLYHVYFADLDNDSAPAPVGTVVRVERYKEIHDGDQKLILPSAIQYHNSTATREEIGKINVFPNPYYGVNRAETSPSERFVTFNHLPFYATIRIYNLAGVLVKTVVKEDETQFAVWDLSNETNLPVASGLYIAQLELRDTDKKDLGTTTLKLMIVQGQRFTPTR